MSDQPPPPSPENTGLATSSAAAATSDTETVPTSLAATATATDDTEAVATSSAAAATSDTETVPTSLAATATATDDTEAVATSSAAAATSDTETVPTSSAATDDTAIERPKPSRKGYVAEVYSIIGINNRASRKPIIALVNKVWMARPEWAIAMESYSELDTTKRNRAEKDLQQELEHAYPSTSFTGKQIRRCQGWLAGHLLAEKHRKRQREAADRV